MSVMFAVCICVQHGHVHMQSDDTRIVILVFKSTEREHRCTPVLEILFREVERQTEFLRNILEVAGARMRSVRIFTVHLLLGFCPSTAGCSPPSRSPIVLCLLLSCSRWFPPSLLGRLVIFCLTVVLISSLSLVVTMCSVRSTYCPSFLLCVRPISTFDSVCVL